MQMISREIQSKYKGNANGFSVNYKVKYKGNVKGFGGEMQSGIQRKC